MPDLFINSYLYSFNSFANSKEKDVEIDLKITQNKIKYNTLYFVRKESYYFIILLAIILIVIVILSILS